MDAILASFDTEPINDLENPVTLRSGVDYASHTIQGPGIGGGGSAPVGGGNMHPLWRYGVDFGSRSLSTRQITNPSRLLPPMGGTSFSTTSFRSSIRLFNGGSTNILESSRILGRADALSRLSSSAPSKLVNIVNQQYRPLPFYARQIGNGGASDATIYEKGTGRLLSPSGHASKVQNDLNGINRLIRNGGLNDQDLRLALELQREMQRALEFNPFIGPSFFP